MSKNNKDILLLINDMKLRLLKLEKKNKQQPRSRTLSKIFSLKREIKELIVENAELLI